MSSEDEKIKKAFENPKYTWRTVRGVSKETGIKRESVKEYISSHGDNMVRSTSRNRQGEKLFASRKVYREKAGVFRRLSSAMKNRGG